MESKSHLETVLRNQERSENTQTFGTTQTFARLSPILASYPACENRLATVFFSSRFLQPVSRASLLFLMFLISVACSTCGKQETTPAEETDPTVVVNSSTGSTTFNVEIADSAAERATGLMNRTSLAEDAGMLFIFEENSTGGFWMQNTLISLDIIFIDEDLRVVYIGANAVPLSLDNITPDEPYRYVLEVNAGIAAQIGLVEGDSVELNI